MHSSALRMGRKFLDIYLAEGVGSILEVGSFNVNGSIRDFKPESSTWTGIDIEPGPGVDVVIEPWSRLPFPDNFFTLAIASSVFEHDIKFWKTLDEMSRTLSKDGYLYISSPSNGFIHTWPVDSFRFYPDAATSFLSIVREKHPNAEIVESFVGAQDEGVWNDFVCVISASGKCPNQLISESEPHEFAYIRGERMFSQGDFQNEDQRKFQQIQAEFRSLQDEHAEQTAKLNNILSSRTWKLAHALKIVK